jgi:hypothetical protein
MGRESHGNGQEIHSRDRIDGWLRCRKIHDQGGRIVVLVEGANKLGLEAERSQARLTCWLAEKPVEAARKTPSNGPGYRPAW